MVKQKRNATASHSATPNGVRSDKKTYRLVGTALAQCIKESGVSVREAARLMRVAPSTVQLHMRKGFAIPPLRSKKLALCFVKNLHLLLEIRNGRAA